MKWVRIETPSRLHLGMFDLAGSLGRRFGGIGVAVNRPAYVLEATPSDKLTASGPDSERALVFADRYLTAAGLTGGARLEIKHAIPGHSGLGSGTKLGLTVALALAKLYDQPTEPYALVQAVDRGRRSAVGLWTFFQGGLVVEGGRKSERGAPAPLLMRYPMPADWGCVLAIPNHLTGLSGSAEAEAFARVSPTTAQAAEISHLVLMSLLPALVDRDLTEFGAAVTRLQQLVGKCFSPVQDGYYSHELSANLIETMLAAGAAGAGQSSWGPTVYGFVDRPETGQRLLQEVKTRLNGSGWADVVSFDNQGVSVSMG
ncbi:MAG TPA: kinase [Anaerolineae bacterium]|nr:kinase [Anaerolineae bacterium]